jgi:hypothetical protein
MTQRFGFCRQCGRRTNWKLHAQHFANQTHHVLWVCSACGRRNPDNTKLYVAILEVAPELTFDDMLHLPTVVDESKQPNGTQDNRQMGLSL